MASRRLRIKPVANVPIRRGRTTENVEKVEDKTEQPEVQKPEEESPSVVNDESLSERSSEENKVSDQQHSTPSVDSSGKTDSKVGVVKPPLLVGKRLRPAVNIAAISRASKSRMVVSKPDTITHQPPSENHLSQKSGCPSDIEKHALDNVTETDAASIPVSNSEDERSANVEKTPIRSFARPSLNRSTLSSTTRVENVDNVTETDVASVPVSNSEDQSNANVEKAPIRKFARPSLNRSSLSSTTVVQNVDNVTETDVVSIPVSNSEDQSSANVEKAPIRKFARPSLNRSSLSSTTVVQNGDNAAGKEQKPVRRHLKAAVNIAALSRSSRQKNSNLTADKDEAKKTTFGITGITELPTKVTPQKPRYEKELTSTNEKLPNDAELPTETGSISGDNSKTINTWPRYKLAKPVPNVQRTSNHEPEDDSSKRSESGLASCTSAGESDDDRSLSQASTVSPPPKLARLSKPFTSRKHIASASESDDDNASKHTLGSAATITPPYRRLSDVLVREDKEDKSEKKCVKPRVLSSSAVRFRKARMEFYSKFNGTTTIDRSRLTMMDLIFYNPVTNPMKSSESKSSESSDMQPSGQTVPPATEEKDEQLADDPEEEDVAMPVPQVKVGPDGQIVLDERSLVIETTGAKKSRQDLANSAVIVDTGTTGNGFYSKKFTKVKEWSKQETLKFYRALNIIGTDFLVMQSIFPKRSRRDLKMKFKREERINRVLVEKALRNPQDFDLSEMEKELAKEEEEEERRKKETQRGKIQKQKVAEQKKRKPSVRRKRSFLSRCMPEEDSGGTREKRPKKKKKRSKSHLKEEKASSDSDEENEADTHNLEAENRLSECEESMENKAAEQQDSLSEGDKQMQEDDDDDDEDDDDEEIKKELQFLTRPPRPTRSGRIPQQKHPLSIVSPAPKPAPKQPVVPLKDLSNIEPGSLVVIATQSPTNPGHQVYKVFMVAPPSQTGGSAPAIAPVTLSPKIMQPDCESDLQMYNGETLSFTSTQNVPTCSQLRSPSAYVSPQPHSSDTADLQVSESESMFIPILPPQSLCSAEHVETSVNPTAVSRPQPFSDEAQNVPACLQSQSPLLQNSPHSQSAIASPQAECTKFAFMLNPQEPTKFTTDLQQATMSTASSENLPLQLSESESMFIPISPPQSLYSAEHVETTVNRTPVSRPQPSSDQAETSVNCTPVSCPQPSSDQAETSVNCTPVSCPQPSSDQAETSGNCTPVSHPQPSSDQAETSGNCTPVSHPQPSSDQAETSVNRTPVSHPQPSSDQAETSVNRTPVSRPQPSSDQAETSVNRTPVSRPQPSSDQAETSISEKNVIVTHVEPPVTYLEHTASLGARKQYNRSPIKDSAACISPTLSTSEDCLKSSFSPTNFSTPVENTGRENNPRMVSRTNSVDGLEHQSNSQDLATRVICSQSVIDS